MKHWRKQSNCEYGSFPLGSGGTAVFLYIKLGFMGLELDRNVGFWEALECRSLLMHT